MNPLNPSNYIFTSTLNDSVLIGHYQKSIKQYIDNQSVSAHYKNSQYHNNHKRRESISQYKTVVDY